MNFKKLIARLLLGASCAFVLVFSALGLGGEVASAATGTGTAANPYVVTTVDELNAAIESTANDVNYIKLGGNITENKPVVQMANDKPFVLNMNNKTITMNNLTENIIDIRGVATIKNGSFLNTSVKAWGMEGSLTMEFVWIRNEMMVGVATLNSCPVTLTNCDITARQQALSLQSRCVANGTKLKANDYIAFIYTGASLCLDGVEYTAHIPASDFPDGYHVHVDTDGDGICDNGYEFMFTGTGTQSDPYLVTSVAQLALAVNCNTQSVNYIKLANDMEGTATVEVEITDKPAVIDLNGKTVTMNNSSYAAFKFYNDSTLKNGTIEGAYVYVSYPGKTVKLEDLTIENEMPYVVSTNKGTTEITRCYLTTTKADGNGLWVADKVVVNHATIEAGNYVSYIYPDSGGQVIFDNSTPMTWDYDSHRYHSHKDVDGDCVCDWGEEPFHKVYQGYTYQDNGDGTHDQIYKCCKGIAEDDAEHVFDQEIDDPEYLKDSATCLMGRVYYKSCLCGATGEETFVEGSPSVFNHLGEPSVYVDNGDGTHNVFYDCCQGAYQYNYHHLMYTEQIATEEYKATDATCTAAATYYKSCKCGAKCESTFESGTPDASAHTGTASVYVDNENGTHDVVYTCCNAVAQDDVACTAIDGDDTCLTAENCACGHVIKAAKTEHTYGDNGSCNDCSAQKPAEPAAPTAPESAAAEESSAASSKEEGGCKGELGVTAFPLLLTALSGVALLRKKRKE